MRERTVVIAMNGVTGRMGRSQHLERSIVAIRDQGGLSLSDGTTLIPEPILVGRNEDRLRDLARQFGVSRWTTDFSSVLADPGIEVYFDSQRTDLRAAAVEAAITAGKSIYCEKPLAERAETAHALADLAEESHTKNGVVQDKLFLPGLVKLKNLVDEGFFGRILSITVDFGYWVFEGFDREPQRPAWNYRAEDGGSMILDMYPHWHYVIEGIFGTIASVSTIGVTHIPVRYEDGEPYDATADDAAYGTMQLEDGAIVQITSSWATRVRRDDLVVFQVDGVDGSAVAGLRGCVTQSRVETPMPRWNPDVPNPIDFRADWTEVDPGTRYDNGFKAQWEMFLRHLAGDGPFPWDFRSAARGMDLVDAAIQSSRERRWVDIGGSAA